MRNILQAVIYRRDEEGSNYKQVSFEIFPVPLHQRVLQTSLVGGLLSLRARPGPPAVLVAPRLSFQKEQEGPRVWQPLVCWETARSAFSLQPWPVPFLVFMVPASIMCLEINQLRSSSLQRDQHPSSQVSICKDSKETALMVRGLPDKIQDTQPSVRFRQATNNTLV